MQSPQHIRLTSSRPAFPPSPSSAPRKPVLDMRAPASFAPKEYRRPAPLPVVSKASSRKRIDGLEQERRSFLAQLSERSLLDTLKRLWRKSELYFRRTKRIAQRLMPELAPRKMLYGSIMGGIAFGMISMAFIAHVFGPGVFARTEAPAAAAPASTEPTTETVAMSTEYDPAHDVFLEYFNEASEEEYKENVRKMVAGYPIEPMLPYIFEKDRLTAAFLIGIAKKESNWGKRVPVLNDQDCFNYWGYRGIRRMMGTGGHTCFNSRKDAVDTISKRIEKLVHSEKLNTPEKMIIWKCGFSCAGHSRESVKKWISDVDMYFSQIQGEE